MDIIPKEKQGEKQREKRGSEVTKFPKKLSPTEKLRKKNLSAIELIKHPKFTPELTNINIDNLPILPKLPRLPQFENEVSDEYRQSLIGSQPPSEANINIFGVEIDGIDDVKYLFYMVSKFVLFDRRYINYNVYKKMGGIWIFQYSLVAYTSSSQVGSWRLCITEAGNRLNKFDDYVQSTTLHYKICQKICKLYYESHLLWADEPGGDVDTRNRNAARNPIIQGVQGAINYDPYVMEGGPNQYLSYPVVNVNTNPNQAITNIILRRGVPDIFDYWSNNLHGKCGDKDYMVEGEPAFLYENNIIQFLDVFSKKLSDNYTPNLHAFLYEDRMTYNTPTDHKRFSSTAAVFLIRSEKKPDTADLSINYPERSRYPQVIDQICVFYTMRQIKKNGELELDVAGSYVQSMPLPCYIVNQLGLYLLYYKGGVYICKPLEYSTQCRVIEYANIRNIIPVEIIENYKFVGFRYSAYYPFYYIYGYNDAEKDIIVQYREGQAIIRILPIKTDADLVITEAEALGQAAANPQAAQAAVNADPTLQRFLTIEYPFLRRELAGPINLQTDLTPGQGLIPGLTLSNVGKNKFLITSISGTYPSPIDTVDMSRSNSFNKILLYGKSLLNNAHIFFREFLLKDVPTDPTDFNSVPVISISGGRHKTNKTNKTIKRYKNQLQTNKRRKCKQTKKKGKTMKKHYKKRKTKKMFKT